MRIKATLQTIVADHKSRLVSKIAVKRGGRRLLGVPPKEVKKVSGLPE